jgi:hypothetical protein
MEVKAMTRENMFVDTKREDWMTDELEKKLRQISKDGKLSCSLAQKFANDNNIPMNKMKSFMDVLKLKAQNCQLGCF